MWTRVDSGRSSLRIDDKPFCRNVTKRLPEGNSACVYTVVYGRSCRLRDRVRSKVQYKLEGSYEYCRFRQPMCIVQLQAKVGPIKVQEPLNQ